MSLKIIKKGMKIDNVKRNYDFPQIDWCSIIDDKEAREKLLRDDTKPVEEDTQKDTKKNEKKQVPVEEAKPAIDLEFLKQQGEKILEDAQAKKDAIEREAFDKGHQTGIELGREEGKSEYKQALDRILESINSLSTFKEDLINRYQPELIKLAIGISEKILKREVQMNSEHILEILNELVVSMKDKSKIAIRLSPEDYIHLKDNEKMNEFRYVSSEFSVEEDPSLNKGDVLLGTSFGTIDGSIGSQLEKIKSELVPSDEV